MEHYDVLLVEDDVELADAISEGIQQSGLTVTCQGSAEDACKVLAQATVGIVVSDIGLPKASGLQLLKILRENFTQLPMILMTAYSDVGQAVDALKMGANDYLAKPFELEQLVDKIRALMHSPISEENIVFNQGRRHRYIELAATVAKSDCSVLLRGESGTGKEVVSRYIHQMSSRANKPFVAINCAAIPENMLESTLFGFEKGAFTGAYASRIGKFEQADGGTLLLDEISEMDIGLQAKLLRVIQEHEVERLGAKESKKIDVRIIATTNRDLAEEVEANRFRRDLYFRLNVFPIVVPPLSKRVDDIPTLVSHFLNKLKRPEIQVTDDALTWIANQPWPGNIRELENFVQRLSILCVNDIVDVGLCTSARDIDHLNSFDSNAFEVPVRPEVIHGS